MTAPAPTPAPLIRVGRFTVLPSQRRLLLDGQAVRVGARAVDLLCALALKPGQVISKDELLHSAWPDLVVEENNLHVQVSALRKLLGHSAIVTVQGHGYALDSSLEVRTDSDDHDEQARKLEVLSPMRGRAVEAATLRKLVRDHRIVTVVGPGGVGKSRLVREVLTSHSDAMVRRIELSVVDRGAALDGPAQVLGEQPSIVVIENAEQSVDAIGAFAQQIGESRNARLVCTSQLPLNATGEHVLRLAPLPVPDHLPGREVAVTPALEVMLDSVATLDADFAPDAGSRREAAAICRHLDGLPLAIMLAAVRVPLLGMAGVRRRLADRFQLLRGGPRGTAPRHQSLQAVMEWSWRLLTPRERDALVALSRLHGRFTLHAATDALKRIARDEWDAMALVGSLVDKSVVLAQTPAHSSFRVMESTRLFVIGQPPG